MGAFVDQLPDLPHAFGTTRDELQRVAAHVLARRRFMFATRFGLRATPGGFGTPAFGEAAETVRVAGGRLVRERTGSTAATASIALAGSTLADLAALVEVDLAEDFSVGDDTPALGDVRTALSVDLESADALARWYALGWAVLDAALGRLADEHGSWLTPNVVQLWPEHFDAGCDVAHAPTGDNRRVNLGASPGDRHVAEPYLYVQPWDPDARPGDPAFWDQPFGASLGYEALRAEADPVDRGVAFLLEGWTRLAAHR